jgi:signal transduction histidine kinase/DNA-binding response OmpR family regulator
MPIQAKTTSAAGPGQSPALNQPAKAHQTILVVDDRAINRDFLVSLLQHFGYQMREAESGEIAWGMAVSGGVDLIITDVYMKGMDGFALLEKLAADPATAQIPALVYTASYKNPDFDRIARRNLPYTLLTKPSTPEVIVDTVQSLLGRGIVSSRTSVIERSDSADSYRAATLIEAMQDLAEERVPARLLQSFCHSARGLTYAVESFVHLLSKEGLAPQTFCSPMRHDRPSELSEEFRPGSTLSRVIGAHATGHFRQANPREYGIPVGDGALFSLLCVPIFTAARDYGCLCLVGKTGPTDFSDGDERLATTLTSQLAILYENALFYEEIQSLAAKLANELEKSKRSEEELERSRKEQARLKDEFLSHVSHELRSPVMVLQQFLEILMEGIPGEINAQQREYLAVALRNTDQLNTMIGDLLDVTRTETGKLRVDLRSMSLQEVLKEAAASARPAAEQRHIELSLVMGEDLPMVIADRSRVRQIVTNLLDNAIKFTPERGVIAVHAGVSTETPGFVRIEVTDTGCGIKSEEIPKVFDRLYQVPHADQSARKGLGLGLCICKQLVALHGGAIQVESRVGMGSTFSFTLPAFSLASLAEPILGEAPVPESLFLVTVELPNSDSADRNATVRETIEHCVLPNLDAALPDTYATGNGQMFVLLARADERGAQILAHRIEDQLKRNSPVDALSGDPWIRLFPVDLSIARQRPTPGEQRAGVVAKIEESLKSILADRS